MPEGLNPEKVREANMDTEQTQKAYPSQRSRRGRWIFGGVLIGLIGLWAMVSTSLRHEKLTDGATLLTSWRSRHSPFAKFRSEPDRYVFDHHWLPDGNLLRVPFSVPGPFQHAPKGSTTLERVDPTTGAVLSTKTLPLRSYQRSTLNEPLLSPDGKWLLLEDRGDIALIQTATGTVRTLPRGEFGKDCAVILAMMSQGGTGTVEGCTAAAGIGMGSYHSPALSLADRIGWARDSRSFFEARQGRSATFHLLQYTLDDKIVMDLTLVGYSGAGTPQVLGQTRTGEILLSDRAFDQANNLFFLDLKTKQLRAVPIKQMFQGMAIRQMELSPDGARILWKTVHVNPPLLESVSRMAEQLAKNPPRFQVAIKVSDLNGMQMHDIAAQKMSAGEEDDFQIIHWLPDSKRVSFWYKSALYTIPAP